MYLVTGLLILFLDLVVIECWGGICCAGAIAATCDGYVTCGTEDSTTGVTEPEANPEAELETFVSVGGTVAADGASITGDGVGSKLVV